MAKRPFHDLAALSAQEREELAQVVARHEDLVDIFAWGRAQTPPVHPADLVKQDEFTHDVLVPFGRGRWLVYGAT
jgi:hypothetical protein